MVSANRNSVIIVTLLCFSFSLLTTPVSNALAQSASVIVIDTAQIGGNNFAFGQVIAPSEQNPLFFHFKSDNSLTYTCKLIKIEEALFNTLNDQVNSIPNDVNLVGTEISSSDCGTGTDGSITYTQSFTDGFYAFQVTGFGAGGLGTKTIWIFETQGGGQAGTGGPEGVAEKPIDVDNFWITCNPIATPTNVNLEKIRYEVQGRAKIDNLKFDGNSLDLIIKTNDLNKEISGELSSASTEDFKIKKVDTLCFYNLPEKAGQSLKPGPTKLFSIDTFKAWNPPVPKCDDKQFKREITYPFKVTSWIGKLKNADSRNIEIAFVVDATPKDHIAVQGSITIDGNDISPNIEIAGQPGVKCSGERLVG